MNTRPDRDDTVRCYVCGTPCVNEKCKSICPKCRIIVENCAGD